MNDTPSIAEKWISWAPRLRSVLRIVAALMFIQNGTMNTSRPKSMPAPANNATQVKATQPAVQPVSHTAKKIAMQPIPEVR